MLAAKLKPVEADAPELCLSPARAALAHAIAVMRAAQERLEIANEPYVAVDRMRVAAAREEAALHAEIQRLHEAHAAAMAEWIAAGASGERPALAAAAFDAARRLAALGAEAHSADHIVAAVEQDYRRAAGAARDAMRERDAAAWPVAVEAAEPLLDDMRRAMSAALAVDARLRGLVLALRAVGDRDAESRAGAYNAAFALEARLAAVLCPPRLPPDAAPGRALLDRLLGDPAAAF